MMLSDTSTEKVISSRPGIPAKIAWPESQNKETLGVPKRRDSLQNNNNNNNNKNQGQERQKEDWRSDPDVKRGKRRDNGKFSLWSEVFFSYRAGVPKPWAKDQYHVRNPAAEQEVSSERASKVSSVFTVAPDAVLPPELRLLSDQGQH